MDLSPNHIVRSLEALAARPLMYANNAQFLEGSFCTLLSLLDGTQESAFNNGIVESKYLRKYTKFVNDTIYPGEKDAPGWAAEHYDDVELLGQFLQVFFNSYIKHSLFV